MKKSPDSWSIPQRQAAGGLLIFFIKSIVMVIKAAWPVVLIMVGRGKTASGNEYLYYVSAIAIFVLTRSILGFYHFTFYTSGKELIIKKGILKKKVLTIPFDRIQSINIEQTVMHQLLNIARLKIDTAGSDKTEGEIDAIAVRKAEAFKGFLLQQVVNDAGNIHATGTEVKPAVRLTFIDILKLGISSNHFQTFFIILAFSLSFLQNLEEIFGEKVVNYLKETSTFLSLKAILAVGISVLLVSVLVSVLRTITAYFDFELSETNQGFRIKAGLLNTRQYLIPYQKIQFFSWRANWLRRQIGLYTVELHQTSNDRVKKKQRIRIPALQDGLINQLLVHYHADIRHQADSVHYIDPSFPVRKMLLPGVPVVLLLITIIFPWTSWNALYFMAALPVQFISAWFFRRNFRLYIGEGAMEVKQGIWGREMKILKWQQLQYVELKQSIYQRTRKLATVTLYTAGGSVKIPFITLKLARMICNYGLYKTESSMDPWM